MLCFPTCLVKYQTFVPAPNQANTNSTGLPDTFYTSLYLCLDSLVPNSEKLKVTVVCLSYDEYRAADLLS